MIIFGVDHVLVSFQVGVSQLQIPLHTMPAVNPTQMSMVQELTGLTATIKVPDQNIAQA